MMLWRDCLVAYCSRSASNAAVSFSERDMRKILRCECLFEKVGSSAEIGLTAHIFLSRPIQRPGGSLKTPPIPPADRF